MDERGGRIQQPVQERAKRLTSAEKSRRCRQKRAKRCKAAEKKRRQRQKIAEKRKGSKRNADTLERIRECLRRKKLREQPNTNALVSIESENSIGESLPSSSDISHLIQKLNSTVLLPDNFQDKLKDLKSSTQKHYLKSTAVDDTNEIHRAPVCVVCDEFIIKLDDMQWIDKDTLLQHSKRLGLKEYEEHHCLILPESLKCQYMVDDPQLKHLLLSPRARRQSNEYMCCTSCKTSLRPHMTEKAPPRLSIANGFAIGKIPDEKKAEKRAKRCKATSVPAAAAAAAVAVPATTNVAATPTATNVAAATTAATADDASPIASRTRHGSSCSPTDTKNILYLRYSEKIEKK